MTGLTKSAGRLPLRGCGLDHATLFDALGRARAHADELAGQLARGQQEYVDRIARLKAALSALLDDLQCRVKAQEPLPKTLRDLPTVLREAQDALKD